MYRSYTEIDSFNPDVPHFFVNGDVIGKLTIGGYYRILVNPGDTVFRFTDFKVVPNSISETEIKETQPLVN